jgi:hypothetical protein
MLGRIDPQEAGLQNLQRVPVRHQEDVATRVPSIQIHDQRRRPVEHGRRRLDAAVEMVGVRFVGRPDPRVVAGGRSFPVTEAPLAEGLRDGDLRGA